MLCKLRGGGGICSWMHGAVMAKQGGAFVPKWVGQLKVKDFLVVFEYAQNTGLHESTLCDHGMIMAYCL